MNTLDKAIKNMDTVLTEGQKNTLESYIKDYKDLLKDKSATKEEIEDAKEYAIKKAKQYGVNISL